MYSKPVIYHFGACDLLDSLMNKSILGMFDIACGQPALGEFRPKYPENNTSLLSLYTDAGSLGLQILDYMYKDPTLIEQHATLYQELGKFDYITYWKKHSTKNDILVLNFSAEFYTKFFNKIECITLLPQIKNLGKLDWILPLLTNHNYLLDFDDEFNTGIARELATDFARSIKEIFGDRVVLVDTHLTEKCYVNNMIKPAVKIQYGFIPYYQNNKMTSEAKNKEYGQRLVKVLLRQFRRVHGGDLPIVSIPENLAFQDPDHRWGSNPFHLHKASADFVGLKIMDVCLKQLSKIS